MAAGVPEARRWRLAAVFAAGVANTSRLMAEAEEAATPRSGGP